MKKLLLVFISSVLFISTLHATTATQSSTGWGGTADRAIDGNTNGVYWNNSVTHTSGSTEFDWLMIDLGSIQTIHDITLWNRTDCCSERLRNVWVMTSDTPFETGTTSVDLNKAKIQANWKQQAPENTTGMTSIPLDIDNISARYILIQKAGFTYNYTNYLSLAEVVIDSGTPPSMSAIPDQSGDEDEAFSLDLSAYTTEIDGDTLTYALSCTPAIDGINLDDATGIFDGTPTAGGTYECSAYATDKDGSSPVVNFQITITSPFVCDGSHGLLGYYYNNRTYTNPISMSRVDSDINFAWSLGSPDSSINKDNFSIKWEGTIYIPEDGEYIFSMAHDDVFILEINGDTIYNSTTWTGGADNFRDAAPVSLMAGTYPISIKFVEWGGGAYAKLAWRNDAGINTQTIIPSDNFCSTDIPLAATDDQYSTAPGITLTGNFISDDTGNGADSGLSIQANTTPTTAPTKGTLTINTNGSFTYIPDLNVTGGDFFDYAITDIYGNTATATVVINLPVAPPSTMGAFQQRYINNLKGNIRIIGNTVLQSQTPNSTLSNARLVLTYVDIDNDGGTFNSSSADINASESGVDITGAKIVWAALYWQGYLHNDDQDIGADTQFNTFNTTPLNLNTSNTRILNTIQNQSILFKVGNGSYTPISPHALGIDRNNFNTSNNYVSYKYSAFAEVTSLLQNSPPNTTYTVANIPTRSGRTGSITWANFGRAYDGLGNYGAWTLVVVYDNTPSPDEKTRNISIYDGYVVLSAANNPNQTISVSGFKTPEIAPNGVDSTLSIFAGEGDRYIPGDFAKITNQDGEEFDLPDTSGAGSYFASVIEGVPDRNPVILNNNGIDIHTTQVGTIPGGVGAIQTNHTSASITLGTTGDTFMPSLITFATELYIPEICYDYTIQQDGFDITNSSYDDRSFRAIGGGQVDINLAIKSEEGDFDFTYSKLNMQLTPLDHADFTEALYAPNNVNTYIPAILSVDHSSSKPSIAIGELPSSNGGTIKALQKYFSKFRYTLDSNLYNGKFDFELNTTIDFGSGPVPLLLSSSQGNIDRCTQSSKYDPLYGSFNVERHNSTGTATEKYPLYTQIVGRDFDFDIVSYGKDPSPAYTSQQTLNGHTVDVELINVRPFNDANATFSCYNPDPGIIQTLTADGKKHLFATFNNTSRVDMSSAKIQTDTALRNAAFRIWYIVDQNNSIVPYTSTDPSDNVYFQNIYDTYLRAGDVTLQASGTHGFCTVDTLGAGGCSSYISSQSGNSGCYACMRDFFSKAVCSRDNFAIRPASYRLSLSDTNESKTPTQTVTLGTNNLPSEEIAARLVAGYKYKIDANATSFVNDQTVAKGYTREFDNSNMADLSSLLRFNNVNACYDTNSTKWGIYFRNGAISNIFSGSTVDFDSGNLLSHGNVGKYAYNISDSNWTIVDQARYADKTFPGTDDCVPDSAIIPADKSERPGCDINSTTPTFTDASGTQVVYNDLYLQYHPYRFELSDINLSIRPDNDSKYLFMTDLDDPYYQTVQSINLTMAAVHEGNLTAMSKDGRVTTNFTDGCAAEEVSLHLTRLTTPAEANLSIPIQRTLVYGSNLSKTVYDDNQTDPDANLSLAAVGFEDQAPYGSAHVRIYSTFQKPNKETLDDNGTVGINPIRINYIDLRAYSPDANASAHMATNIPKGIVTQDRNVTFLYGRVVPAKKLYRVTEDDVDTTLMVAVYCDGANGPCSNNDLNSTATAEDLSGNWYLAAALFDNPDLMFGDTILDINHLGGKDTNITMKDTDQGSTTTDTETDPPELTQRHFEKTALKQNLNIKMNDPSASNRPTRVRIGIYPPVWLRFDPNAAPHGVKTPAQLGDMSSYFDTLFIPKPTAWTGHGKTGHIVGDMDNGDDINTLKTKRLEW